jgi:hypothetical protein
MTHFKNALEVFNLLDHSNCRECGFKTCMAFAGAVFLGQRTLADCPKVDAATLARFATESQSGPDTNDAFEALLRRSAQQLAAMDLAAAAERTGGRYINGHLVIHVLGKEVAIDPDGRLRTDIHVNPWVAGPLYNYVIHTPGLTPTGDWRSFRELEGGRDRYPLFRKRGEEALKQVADRYPDLFQDMVDLFGARQVERQFQSDISVVLHPLPKLPLLICYAFAEEGIASTLNLFFDSTADRNLDIGSIYNIGAGLAQMFEKLARRHGVVIPPA